MDELANQITLVLETIISLTDSIMRENYAEEERQLLLLQNMLITVFPEVIMCYTKPEFEPVKQDMQYWVTQTKRILESLEKEDKFSLIDLLRYETYDNLKLFQKMLDGMK